MLYIFKPFDSAWHIKVYQKIIHFSSSWFKTHKKALFRQLNLLIQPHSPFCIQDVQERQVVCTDLLSERRLCCRQTSTRFIGNRWQIHDKSILGAVFMEFVACCSRCSARPLQRKVKHFCNQISKSHISAPLFFNLSNV